MMIFSPRLACLVPILSYPAMVVADNRERFNENLGYTDMEYTHSVCYACF